MLKTILVSVVVLLGVFREGMCGLEKLEQKQEDERIEGQYIIVLKPDVKQDAFLNKYEAKRTRGFPELRDKGTSPFIDVFSHVFSGFSAKLDNETLHEILGMDEVEFVEENSVVRVQGANYVGSWGIDRVNKRQLPLNGRAEFTGNGSGVTVYVVDSGIIPSNVYFNGRARVGFNAVEDKWQGRDCHGHGTHCAGTIGAYVYGIATGASLVGVKVVNCEGMGNTMTVLKGLEWIRKTAVHPAVASMSLGAPKSRVWDRAVKTVIASGVLVSVAAGNSAERACRESPARVPEAITVGATDINDNRASFSNFGKCVDIFAPGVDITSTWFGTTTATKQATGTSMACPHVTGAAAIALGNNSTLTPGMVKETIVSSATSGALKNEGKGSPNLLLYIP